MSDSVSLEPSQDLMARGKWPWTLCADRGIKPQTSTVSSGTSHLVRAGFQPWLLRTAWRVAKRRIVITAWTLSRGRWKAEAQISVGSVDIPQLQKRG